MQVNLKGSNKWAIFLALIVLVLVLTSTRGFAAENGEYEELNNDFANGQVNDLLLQNGRGGLTLEDGVLKLGIDANGDAIGWGAAGTVRKYSHAEVTADVLVTGYSPAQTNSPNNALLIGVRLTEVGHLFTTPNKSGLWFSIDDDERMLIGLDEPGMSYLYEPSGIRFDEMKSLTVKDNGSQITVSVKNALNENQVIVVAEILEDSVVLYNAQNQAMATLPMELAPFGHVKLFGHHAPSIVDNFNVKGTVIFDSPYPREDIIEVPHSPPSNYNGPREKLVGLAYSTWFDTATGGRWDNVWGTPQLGFYKSDDSNIINQHAEWIADAGVDFITIDWANNVKNLPELAARPDLQSIEDNTIALLEQYLLLDQKPKVSIMLGTGGANKNQESIKGGYLTRKADLLYEQIVGNPRYADLIQFYLGKPLLIVYLGTPTPWPNGVPSWNDDRYTVRYMTGFVTQQPHLLGEDRESKYGYWSWEDRGDQTYAMHNGHPENMVITASYRGVDVNESMGRGRENGQTFKDQWERARDLDVDVAFVQSWNEWVSHEEHSPEFSNDLEPSLEHGDFYLQLLEEEIAKFKEEPEFEVTAIITASPSSAAANGTSPVELTVQLQQDGEDLTASGGEVALASTLGDMGEVTDHGDGTYSAVLTAPSMAGTALISAQLNGEAIAGTASVTFTAYNSSVYYPPALPEPEKAIIVGEDDNGIVLRLQTESLNELIAMHTKGEALVIETNHAAKQYEVVFPQTVVEGLIAYDSEQMIDIRTPLGAFQLPLRVLDLSDVEGEDKEVVVTLQSVDFAGEWMSGGTEMVAPLISFDIEIRAGDQSKSLNQFGSTYVSRIIYLEDKLIDPSHSTGVVFDPTSGEFRFVPTVFRHHEGRWEAIIQRTSNSLYTVITGYRIFNDVKGHWAEEDIEMLASKRIINGVTEELFDLGSSLTRAQFTTLLVRSLGLDDAQANDARFIDIAEGASYAGPVYAALQAGLIGGYSDATFRPNQALHREELAVILSNTLTYLGRGGELQSAIEHSLAYADAAEISAWAVESVGLATEIGLMQGRSDHAFAPMGMITRAEAAVVLRRLLQHVGFIN
ncbi:S-layer homology domain-containing protein [Paenibacillus sp. 1P07SE]|uniref:S-layer homology domain-containing protein n=1 Tax=Paenibacillus sp. 1P07SE TaxID=3132209 RepID=UPI0039A45C43